ncbi:NADH-dependent butanol dehydrogenase A [Clostridium pasteurianum DSM 525 = ATCC 6013]|uniref:Alcohol dehydrogenase (NADP(+)) n=1 Tax=Clostridium pasteurianum DSM 525 = ATCC 6013 TaxID=1262449 RepID=A0A0H3J1D7_CLOPA|nr:iron-containing alcohol dehydrogenase [Clostridium pasteurianum]AJA46537.1 NADH-dependent butanol dehydrogenase A [Clostridium pasteurianum DSM 525 = ATCC 6013]AJA50525.1 NADH-dependent butanol dehydrogenase A [Clostridium pasteurianum DSM 525 = ATCC 6013]AOZ73961.1 butanol dehydrogenase [Clostridium pasteurianum DSM 525 = ATCC 6013]AOZ77758.1 butanol dehydrogenase [Clostridium pasteurianum]ELP61109.1 NADH-dependent butanol dehydrogenase A (BDH I) [Clostridium pasteurianum DSM 525 = ATCC 60
MLNFDYSIPTKIFFGKGKIGVLPAEIKKYGSKILLVYGGGSIKRNGIYEDITKGLKDNSIDFWELSGVEPNPRITTVRKGIEICRKNNIDLVLAIGGGSSIDCAKVIAAGYYYEGDAWDIVKDARKISKVLPVASVLTLAATGSEMDIFGVITNMDTNEKIGVGHPDMIPRFSVLDPTYTFTVPRSQTAAGTADIMSHIMEAYFSSTKEAFLQDRMAEALLKTCINYGRKAMDEPENYEARANLMWASSLAINGLLSYGKHRNWVVHPMEHELSAYYDITHGVGLAILTPYWMKYILDDSTVDKFAEFGINVWNIDASKDKYDIANAAIDKTREYFNLLEIPSKLSEVGIKEDKLEEMARQSVRKGNIGSLKPIGYEGVLNIFKEAL